MRKVPYIQYMSYFIISVEGIPLLWSSDLLGQDTRNPPTAPNTICVYMGSHKFKLFLRQTSKLRNPVNYAIPYLFIYVYMRLYRLIVGIRIYAVVTFAFCAYVNWRDIVVVTCASAHVNRLEIAVVTCASA